MSYYGCGTTYQTPFYSSGLNFGEDVKRNEVSAKYFYANLCVIRWPHRSQSIFTHQCPRHRLICIIRRSKRRTRMGRYFWGAAVRHNYVSENTINPKINSSKIERTISATTGGSVTVGDLGSLRFARSSTESNF